LLKCEKYLFSDKLQLGFKKYIGCGPDIHCVQEIVNYFRSRNSRVFLTTVDASKPFDRVNHMALFRKLRECKLPYCVISVIQNWYSKLYSVVRWNSVFSSSFRVMWCSSGMDPVSRVI